MMLLNTYWLIDNKLIFDDEWSYKMTQNDYVMSGHYIGVTHS